jgi:hypothetical protein
LPESAAEFFPNVTLRGPLDIRSDTQFIPYAKPAILGRANRRDLEGVGRPAAEFTAGTTSPTRRRMPGIAGMWGLEASDAKHWQALEEGKRKKENLVEDVTDNATILNWNCS